MNKKTSRSKKSRNRDNMGNMPGSGTSSYYRNKRLIEAGETFRSQKRRGPGKAPRRYRSRF